MKVDYHIHSLYSDGIYTVEEILPMLLEKKTARFYKAGGCAVWAHPLFVYCNFEKRKLEKEVSGEIRSGRMLLFAILFSLFGIMNPAITKLTPWMLGLLSDQLAERGMIVENAAVVSLFNKRVL